MLLITVPLNEEGWDEEKQEFWTNRAISMDITNPINKKKNVLWCIRLISENL